MASALFPVYDCHCDSLEHFDRPGYRFAQPNLIGHVDLPRLRAGGVALQIFAICAAGSKKDGLYLREVLKFISRYHRCLVENSRSLLGVECLPDLHRAASEGKIACLLALEGGEPLEDSLELLDIFYYLGLRCLALTWNRRNSFADGVADAASGGGLSAKGRQAVRMIAEKGIVLDLAHISPRGYFEALELAPNPPLVSHANARRLCDHPRNLTDEQLKALAEKDGVVGISFYPPFIAGRKSARLDQLVDHFVHAAGVAGIEHVGIGSDFDGIDTTVDQLSDASRYGVLLEALRGRGFQDRELALIAGGNVRRLLEQNLRKSVSRHAEN